MNWSNKEVAGMNYGFYFSFLLTIGFIIFKVTNIIAWSWWWVFSPMWIPIVCIVAIFVATIIIAILLIVIKGK